MYANLSDAGTHFVHGLPIRGIQPSLNEAQLETGSAPGFCRKHSDVFQARTDELQTFHRADYISLLMRLSNEAPRSPAFAAASAEQTKLRGILAKESNIGLGGD